MTKNIIFVCHGNICRSPMAEFIMKDIVNKASKGDQYQIDSAAATQDAIGHNIDSRAQRALSEHNIPFANHFARQLTREDYQKYDYLIALDEENFFDINRICGGDPEHKEYKLLYFAGSYDDVDDPWYTGDFEKAYQDIYRGCQALFEKTEKK